MSPSHQVHGLDYSPAFLSSLPILLQRPAPHQPIRAISASQFANIHLKYLTSHAPDNAIFPFLHGLEGENEAQNMFFAASGSISGRDGSNVARVPNFRGLIWVACDDELSSPDHRRRIYHPSPSFQQSPIHNTAFLHHSGTDEDDQLISSSDDDYDSSSETTSDDLETFAPMPMDIDLDLASDPHSPNSPAIANPDTIHARMELDPALQGESPVPVLPDTKEFSPKGTLHHHGAHMHPVNQRTQPDNDSHTHIHHAHDRRSSEASTISSTSTSSTTSSLLSPPVTVPSQLNQNPLDSPPVPFSPSPSPPPPPPLLTSSFRARELLREVKELRELSAGGGHAREVSIEDAVVEFVEPRVPDGISLRNFGIQTPIFATLSDIVVYSPRGNFKAALALAEKFKQAIEGKYARRVEKVREVSRRSGSPHSNSPDASSACSPEEDLVKYNVFVLDASLEEMHDSLAHLVSRVEDVRVDHAFTDGTDAHVHGPGEGAYDADFDMEFVDSMEAASPPSPPSSSSSDEEGLDQLERGMNGSKVDSTTHTPTASSFRVLKPKDKKAQKKEKKKKRTILRANTINFAQREKDEMRDLTQASEILTYYPDGYKVVTSSPVSVSPAMSLVSSQDSSSTPISDSESSTPGSTSNPQAGRNSQFVEEDLISGSSTANYWDPSLGQIYLGNSSDVPLPPNDPLFARRQWRRTRNNNSNLNQHPNPYQLQDGDEDNVFDWRTNDPNIGFGYDICVECDDLAPFPSAVHMRAAEEHVRRLDKAWVEQCLKRHEKDDPDYSARGGGMIPPRPPPHASAVVHLPFPSSVSYTTSLLPFISWLEGMVRPVEAMSVERAREALRPTPRAIVQATPPPNTANGRGVRRASTASGGFVPSSLPPPSSFPTTFLPPATSSSGYTRVRSTSATYLHNAGSSQSHSPSPPSTSNSSPGPRSQGGMQTRPPTLPQSIRTRPLKILIYSADGYTESSSLALCLLMALKGLTLPEAYLELQVEKKRSFFVYQGEVGALKRVEGRLEKERERLGFGFPVGTSGKRPVGQSVSYPSLHSNRVEYSHFFAAGSPLPQMSSWGHAQQQHEYQYSHQHSSSQHCYSNAMSDGHPASAHPLSSSIPNESSMALAHHAQTVPMLSTPTPPATPKRPRASTLPALPSFRDHQAWFNDPRFDGSFPSRVLPFLYLGNLNHATNAYMLHALGITHVVSVGECALVPPPNHHHHHHHHQHPNTPTSGSCGNAQFVQGKGPGGQGSLWIEEREGRIKVLDIKGVCDDGIDTLEPQLAPICDWIDRARLEGGKVLVHCRVGVSRSATVTIAYVMKYLSLPLVDAYLIVRSRRLSVLIQPNMRLLYNLLGWEVKLAMEHAGEDEKKLKGELARCLNWPYLAKEVHTLNEKYLR